MISGKDFKSICNWNLCNRYDIKFNILEIKEDDFIFLNLDNIFQYIKLLKENKLPKFNLITHNSDLTFDSNILKELKPFVKHIYCINSVVTDNCLTKIPLGFSDRLSVIIDKVEILNIKKNLVYLNFYHNRNKERLDCLDYFRNFDWIFYENDIPNIDYYNSLENSKYSLCPIGTGLDTHRFYESIYLNTIPIIKRNKLSDLHEKFPCIIIDSWNEINKEFLVKNYDDNLNQLINWKKNNDWLNPKFWIKK